MDNLFCCYSFLLFYTETPQRETLKQLFFSIPEGEKLPLVTNHFDWSTWISFHCIWKKNQLNYIKVTYYYPMK